MTESKLSISSHTGISTTYISQEHSIAKDISLLIHQHQYYRFVMIEKSKRRDVAIVDVIIPTDLACVLFGAAIQFYLYV